VSVLNQKTIKSTISFNGIGLHSGKKVNMILSPASPNSGIVFKRSDLKKNNLVYPSVFNVSSASYCTKITNEYGVSVSTVEHLMAALCGLGIDNILIDLNSEELPIMDGSSREFLKLIERAGVKRLSKKRKFLKILKSFRFENRGREILIEPSDDFEVDFQLDFPNQLIGQQKNSVNFFKDNLTDVMNSRTFCLYEDIEKIKKDGLAKGGSLDNALVIKNEKVLNVGGLRNKKEFVNHKILDLAGDIALSEFSFLGKIICYRGGHELTNIFLKELLNNYKEFFEIVEIEDEKISKISHKTQSTRLVVNA